MLHFAFLWNFVERGVVDDGARNVHLFKGMDVFICVIECSVGLQDDQLILIQLSDNSITLLLIIHICCVALALEQAPHRFCTVFACVINNRFPRFILREDMQFEQKSLQKTRSHYIGYKSRHYWSVLLDCILWFALDNFSEIGQIECVQ